MRLWKRWLACLLALCLCFLCTGCHTEKAKSRFGMDINLLNPLVLYATDCSTGETVFSRDSNIISKVMSLFEKFPCTPADQVTSGKGIRFTVSTMYGDFAFGEIIGNRLRLNGNEYILDEDYSETMRLYYEKLKSETNNTGIVTRESILEIVPEMTYRELLDRFGNTMITAAVGDQKAYLYQYNGRPFYILFNKETDAVGITGEQLLEEIWESYNLGNSLTQPEPLSGGRLSVYTQSFDRILDKLLEQGTTPSELILDTGRLVHLNDTEREELIAHLQERYSLPVLDSESAEQIAVGDEPEADASGKVVLWVEQYTYIGDDRMDFTAAGRWNGESAVTEAMEFTLQDEEWKG